MNSQLLPPAAKTRRLRLRLRLRLPRLPQLRLSRALSQLPLHLPLILTLTTYSTASQ